MMAKPMKTLELHYPTIQFLINTSYATLSRWYTIEYLTSHLC